MLKFCVSQRAGSERTAMSLAGHTAHGLCLLQTPPHADTRQTGLWRTVPLHLLPIQHKGTSSRSPAPSPGLALFSILVSRGTDSFSLKPISLHELSNIFSPPPVRKNLALKGNIPPLLHVGMPSCKPAAKMTVIIWDKWCPTIGPNMKCACLLIHYRVLFGSSSLLDRRLINSDPLI